MHTYVLKDRLRAAEAKLVEARALLKRYMQTVMSEEGTGFAFHHGIYHPEDKAIIDALETEIDTEFRRAQDEALEAERAKARCP